MKWTLLLLALLNWGIAVSNAQDPALDLAALENKQQRLLALQKKNTLILESLSEKDFSSRIKVKSNLVIITTELLTIAEQIEKLKEPASELKTKKSK